MPARPLLASFLKFGGLSGLGWLADACILLALVGLLGMAPFAANFISSSIAALSVFLLSRELVFNKASGRTALRIAAYLAYVVLVIAVASLMLDITLELGLGQAEITLLALTVVTSIITLQHGRVTVMQGAIHLTTFFAFLFLAVVP